MQPTNTYLSAQTCNHRILLWSQQSSPLSTLLDLDPPRRTKRNCTVHTHAVSGEIILTNIAMQRFTSDQAVRNFSQYIQCVKGKCQICKHSTVYDDYEAEKAREVEHGDVEGRLVRRRGGLFDPVDRLRAFGATPANPIVIRDRSADSHLSERAKRWLED